MDFIKDLKKFYCITDFKKEIYDWKFESPNSYNRILNEDKVTIGHPTNSHKGSSLGDIIPYTRLPEEIYTKFGKKVYIPSHFAKVFEFNPYITGISNNLMQWGSLGTFGTTVQRTCNVWGIKTKYFTPKIYTNNNYEKNPKLVSIGINSNAGGSIQNILFLAEELLKLKEYGYRLVQLATTKDILLPGMDQYYFNISFKQLKNILYSSEYYIGMHSSLYHVAKALGTNVIGLLPENEDTYFVKLPFLTQCNYLETEMLPLNEKERMYKWMDKCKADGKNPDSSHHVGWLYPDTCHLTMNPEFETPYVPKFNIDNLIKAMNNEVYPFNNPIYFNYYDNLEAWI